MRKTLTHLLVWLFVMSVLTLCGMGIWLVLSGGSQSTASLKWLQLVQTACTFLLPPVVCAWVWDADHRPLRWLGLDRSAGWQVYVLAVAVMLCGVPAINLLADLNSRIVLPESLSLIEQKLRMQEETAAALIERFLAADSVWEMVLNIGLMALMPAISEEMAFRGALQQILYKGQRDEVQGTKARVHVAIWVSAFVFSAIHMQFFGFIPRMLMGALFGYVFVWTGSLWVPMLMHFTNNSVAIGAYYLFGGGEETNYADTIGAGATWWLGVVSLIAVCVLLVWLHRYTKR